jgi:hypothetical protein
MTEKEFLIAFLECAEAMGKLGDNNVLDKFIDEWLDYHHKTYYEVKFVKSDHYNDSEPLTFKGVPIVFDKDIK